MNDWDRLQKMLEEWITEQMIKKGKWSFELGQSMIPIRDFIFDRTDGAKSMGYKEEQ